MRRWWRAFRDLLAAEQPSGVHQLTHDAPPIEWDRPGPIVARPPAYDENNRPIFAESREDMCGMVMGAVGPGSYGGWVCLLRKNHDESRGHYYSNPLWRFPT